jgi:hypothetical protein
MHAVCILHLRGGQTQQKKRILKLRMKRLSLKLMRHSLSVIGDIIMGVAAGRRAGHLGNIIIVHKIASPDSI